jgi:hypothetical protein
LSRGVALTASQAAVETKGPEQACGSEARTGNSRKAVSVQTVTKRRIFFVLGAGWSLPLASHSMNSSSSGQGPDEERKTSLTCHRAGERAQSPRPPPSTSCVALGKTLNLSEPLATFMKWTAAPTSQRGPSDPEWLGAAGPGRARVGAQRRQLFWCS